MLGHSLRCGFPLFGPLELDLTDWAVFLAFCNSYTNWEISRFSKIALYSMIMLPIHIYTNVFSSQWS